MQPSSPMGTGTYSPSVRVHDSSGDVSLAGPSLQLMIVDATAGDFNGDGKTDLGVFRPATARWITVNTLGAGSAVTTFGATYLADIPVPGDYEGVGYTEPAVLRPATGQWFVFGPDGGRQFATFGQTGLRDYPLLAPIASLKSLGTVGGIRTAAVVSTTSAPAESAALMTTSAPAAGTIVSTTATLAPTSPQPPAAFSARQDAYMAAALDSLASGRATLQSLASRRLLLSTASRPRF